MTDHTTTETITVRVKPGSRKGPLVEHAEGDPAVLTVYVPEPAVDGKANKAVIIALAKHFGIAKSRVELVTGPAARIKRFRIAR